MASKSLERDIADMEDRLASVKVRVEAERVAWKRSYRTGKSGTKWKSAASKLAPPLAAETPALRTESSSVSAVSETSMALPSDWDALELAQYLQAKQLRGFAQVVIYEQITGQVLLDTAPGKMRQLFQDVVASASDPNWKAFLQATAELSKQQKRMEKALPPRSESRSIGAGQECVSLSSPRGAPTLFPQISPRVPSLKSIGLRASTSETLDSRASEKTSQPKATMPQRKPAASSHSQLATCWNCGARFPRSQSSVRLQSKATRTFCSAECERVLESADMSISASVSASVQVSSTTTRDVVATVHSDVPTKLRAFQTTRQKSKSGGGGSMTSSLRQPPAPVEGLVDLLQVAHKRGPFEEVPPQPPRPQPSEASGGSGSGKHPTGGTVLRKRIKAAASISAMRGVLPATIPALVLTSTSEASRHCKVVQQSIYKLDPELFQTTIVGLATCFLDRASSGSAVVTRQNLMRLQEFVSVKALYRLSLASRLWFGAVHHSSLTDPLWGFHLLRKWKRSDDDDVFLHDIGALTKPERPREMLKRLTRRVGRLVLENMKALLSPENWLLAAPMRSHPTLMLQSVLRASRQRPTVRSLPSSSPPTPDSLDATIFEHIALVFNRKGEVVAVRAQELIRPLAEDAAITDVLVGMRTGTLFSVECRRLRLFSAANRLPLERWSELSHCRVVFDFFWSTSSSLSSAFGSEPVALTQAAGRFTVESPLPRVWHQTILERMQKVMQLRLLGKDSVQQVLKAVQEHNGPPQALVALEKFLTACHASGMAPPTSKKR